MTLTMDVDPPRRPPAVSAARRIGGSPYRRVLSRG